ncbi:MAG: PA14 domain-containing protein [Bacteroidota bacterium]
MRRLVSTLLFVIFYFAIGHAQQGLKADYYNGTNFNQYVTSEYVSKIDQSWYDTPPVPGIDPHVCSIRWTGKLTTAKTGTYSFSAQVDDGIRVWIDNELIIDQWELNDLGRFKGTTQLAANQEYNLKVEYFNGMIEGEVRLLWKMHKEDLSWYERMFGDGIEFTVIAPEHFLRPEEPVLAKKEDVKPKPPKKKKKKTPQKKPVITPVKENKPAPKPVKTSISPQPVKEVIKPEPSTPEVSAEVAEKYIPKDIQFEKGKTRILASSFKELDAFVRFMHKYPHLNVKVEGHTDVIGDAQLNLVLSKNRAKTITDYLVRKGINSRRITHEGYGGTRPLMVPEEGKYYPANRRVVFIVEGLE